MKIIQLTLSLLLMISFPAVHYAQSWQSDMQLEMKQSNSGYQIYEIVVSSNNDDASRSPHLIFTLPRNSRVNTVKVNGSPTTAYQVYGNAAQALPYDPERMDAYVKIDFPSLNKEKVKVTISIEEVGKGWQKNDGASAYVFSLTPELNKENNFVYLPLE